MGVVGGMKLDGRLGVALEFEGGWFGRIRAGVLVPACAAASREVGTAASRFRTVREMTWGWRDVGGAAAADPNS